jgi:integrase
VSDIDSERSVIHIHQADLYPAGRFISSEPIHIQQRKGSHDRDVPTTGKLLEALRQYFRWKRPKIHLFPGTAGHRGDETPVFRPYNPVRLAANRQARRDRENDRRTHPPPQLRDGAGYSLCQEN